MANLRTHGHNITIYEMNQFIQSVCISLPRSAKHLVLKSTTLPIIRRTPNATSFPHPPLLRTGGITPKKTKKGTTNPNLEKTDTKKKKRFNDKEQENQENDDKRPHILIVAPDPMKLCCK